MVSNAIYNCSAAMSQLLIDAAFNKQLNVSSNAAPIVAAPVQMSMKNLHPTLYPGLGVATTLGLIVLMILAGSVVGSTTATFSPLLFKVPPVHLVLMRPLYAVWLSSQVALIMTTIITLFGTPVAKGFVMLWLFLWLCMHCFISTNALIIIAIGLQFSGFVIAVYTFLSMSCSQFSLPIEFSPVFFKMGYAMPLFHAVQGARHIIFGSYNQILMNTLVLLAYTIVFMILIPIVFWSKILINKYHCISKLQLYVRGTVHELEMVLKGITSPGQKTQVAPDPSAEQQQHQDEAPHSTRCGGTLKINIITNMRRTNLRNRQQQQSVTAHLESSNDIVLNQQQAPAGEFQIAQLFENALTSKNWTSILQLLPSYPNFNWQKLYQQETTSRQRSRFGNTVNLLVQASYHKHLYWAIRSLSLENLLESKTMRDDFLQQYTSHNAACWLIMAQSALVPQVVRCLYESKALQNTIATHTTFAQQSISDMTYLHYAAWKQNKMAVKWLVVYGACLYTKTKEGLRACELWPEGFVDLPALLFAKHVRAFADIGFQ